MQSLRKSPAVWIAGLVFLVYLRSLSFDFTWFDDNLVVLDHLAFLGDPSNLPQAFGEDVFRAVDEAYYRPLLTVSLMLDTILGGGAPFVYHLTNLLLHALASCLVFALLGRLGYERDRRIAGALLFALLPVHTQAVAWIMGRNDLLLACFALPSFLFFVDARTRGGPRAMGLHFACLLAALFTKETAVAIPVVCLAWMRLSRAEDRRQPATSLGLLGAGWLGCIAMWWIARSAAFHAPRGVGTETLARSASELVQATLLLLGKILLPLDLAVLPTLEDSSLALGILSAIGVAVAVVATPRERRWVSGLGAIWFLAFLLPTLVSPRATGVRHFLEHRALLPSVGVLLIALESPLLARFRFASRPKLAALAVVLSAYALCIQLHLPAFRDRIAFWESAVHDSPSHPLAHRNLGSMYYLERRPEDAERHYLRALELSPGEEMVHNNLGLLYMDRGEADEARAAFLREIEGNPRFADPYYNLAVLTLREARDTATLEDVQKAALLLEQALALNPNHPRAGVLLRQLHAGPAANGPGSP